MEFVISDASERLYNDGGPDTDTDLVQVTAEDFESPITRVTRIDGGDDAFYRLVAEDVASRDGYTVQQAVGCLGMAGTYRKVGS